MYSGKAIRKLKPNANVKTIASSYQLFVFVNLNLITHIPYLHLSGVLIRASINTIREIFVT